MREHGRGLDGRTVGRRAQTGCGRRRREREQHGAWLTRRAGTSRPGRQTGGQTCKPTAQIEPKSRWLVFIITTVLCHCICLLFNILILFFFRVSFNMHSVTYSAV